MSPIDWARGAYLQEVQDLLDHSRPPVIPARDSEEYLRLRPATNNNNYTEWAEIIKMILETRETAVVTVTGESARGANTIRSGLRAKLTPGWPRPEMYTRVLRNRRNNYDILFSKEPLPKPSKVSREVFRARRWQ